MAWEGEAPKENKVSSWEGQAPKESSFSFSEMASNIPSSGVEFLKNMVQPLLHPIETGKALGKTGMGFIEKLIPGDQGHEQFADSMLNFFTERYGGMDKFLKTVQNDPVGFAADLSTVFGGAGTALQASKIGLLSKAGKVASTAGKVLNPVTAPFEAAGGVRTLLSKTELPESIYARTMKMPPGSLGEEGRASVLQTLVREEKLPLGKNTLFKVNQIIKDTDKKIGDTLEALSQQGAQVDINVVVNALDDLKTAYKNRPNPQPYYKAIEAVKQDYINHSFVNQGRLTLTDAQALKKGTYQEISSYYMKQQKPETGRIGIQNDIDAASKAKAAQALRQAVLDEPSVPQEIKVAMKKEAGLMNARKWVERATNRGGNLDPISLSGMLFGVLAEKGIPGAAAWRIAVSQPVMSRFAIWLGSGSEKLSLLEKAAMPGTIGMYQAGRTAGPSIPPEE